MALEQGQKGVGSFAQKQAKKNQHGDGSKPEQIFVRRLISVKEGVEQLKQGTVDEIQFKRIAADQRKNTVQKTANGKTADRVQKKGDQNAKTRCDEKKRIPVQTIGPEIIEIPAITKRKGQKPQKRGKQQKQNLLAGEGLAAITLLAEENAKIENGKSGNGDDEVGNRPEGNRDSEQKEKNQQVLPKCADVVTQSLEIGTQEIEQKQSTDVPVKAMPQAGKALNAQKISDDGRKGKILGKGLEENPNGDHTIKCRSQAAKTSLEKTKGIRILFQRIITSDTGGE